MTEKSANPPAVMTGVSSEQMRLLLEVSRSLAITVDLDALLMRLALATATLLACERSSVFLHDLRRNELWTKVALQSDPIRIAVSSGIAGMSFRSNEVIHCLDAYSDERFNPEPDRISGFTTRDLLTAPMTDWDGQPVGVLQAINKISGAFTEIDVSLLRLLADQAGVAIQRHNLQQEALRSLSLQHEMHLALRVQQAMIPKRPPVIPGFTCAGWTRAASINGGDCYDLWSAGDRLGILVADASGHGMGSALVVSQVRALVRTLCESEPDPAKVLLRINDRLAADLEPGRFVTAFLGFISPDGLLQWCSAGHGPTLLCRQAQSAEILDATWPPLGLLRDADDVAPEPVLLEPGGSLIVLSDGITEAFDVGGDLFGAERVIAVLDASCGKSPDEAIAAMREGVLQWQGHENPADDQTLVVVRRNLPRHEWTGPQ